MSLYLYLDAVTNLYILKHKGFVFNPKAGSLMLIEREEDGFVNLQALYDNKAFRQNTNGHILNDFIDPETVVNELGVSYGNDAQAIRTALADFFVDAPSGGGGLSVEQVKSQSTTKAPSSKLFADVTGDLELGFKSSIASLENVINSANINQELTATATGVDIVALPKTAANTGMRVQMFGQSAQNLVVNGDFRNGTTGWEVDGAATKDVSTGRLVYTAVYSPHVLGNALNFVAGNKYYFYIETEQSAVGSSTPKIMVGYFPPVNSSTALTIQNVVGLRKTSGIYTPSEAFTYFRVYTYVPVGQTVAFDNIRVIDLTATFGAGNEPTKEQCDVLFANYFEGTDNVLGTGRIRSVGKNLFDGTLEVGELNFASGLPDVVIDHMRSRYFNPVKPNAQIRVSHVVRFFEYDKNFNFIQQRVFFNSPTDVTNSNTAYYKVIKWFNDFDFSTFSSSFSVTYGDGPATYEPYRQSILQLTTPPLRSNGLIKDEIRKGTNGYELVKRVGVGTLGTNGISGGDFEGGLIGLIGLIDEIATWTLNTVSPISGTRDGRLQVTTIGTYSTRPLLSIPLTRSSGQLRKISFKYKVNSGTCILYGYNTGGGSKAVNAAFTGTGTFSQYYLCDGNTQFVLYFNGTNLFDVQFDDIKDELIAAAGLTTSTSVTELGSNVHYTLATPTITPIAHAGLLNSNSNGTAYFEPIIADAGVYASNLAIQLTDYQISSFESIRKYANGTYTELNTATAVIASGGLSFTHPDLASGDLVMFTYAYNKDSIGRSMTLTHYDSRFVEADTANGKVYRIVPVVTNGVVSWTAVEV